MVKIKKYFTLFCLVVLSFAIVACGSDTEAPTMTIANSTITHNVNDEVDFLEGITVTDNVTAADKIKLEVSDWGSYDKSKEGTYEITIKATDEKGNFVEKKITVKVEKPDEGDKVAPMINASSNVTINHLAGEEYDLTNGLTGVDNVDGTNISFKVVDLGNYKKDVAGTYKVKIVAYDKAGNESAPIERTIVVSNSYTRAEMTSFEGELIRYKALYNPQVLNGNTGTGYNNAYDGHYVNVLSKDYVDWLLEYAPERMGANVGWSVIAVTDKDDKIVYVRHWSSGEAFHDEEGNLISQRAKTWSTGTIYTWTEEKNGTLVGMSNARYSSGEMGLMMANINEYIPEDGHVFLFLNWTTLKLDENDNVVLKANESDMPRSMGTLHIMNSDEDGDEVMDYAIGRTLKILDPELSDQVIRKSFDKDNPFPIISIPSIRYINQSGVWKRNYTEKVYLSDYDSENPYNPLKGVTANDGKGNDITNDISYKVYSYTTPQLKYGLFPSIAVTDPLWEEFFEETYKLSESETTLEAALQAKNDQVHFVIEYTVTANGQTDKAYRLIQVQAQNPDYLELFGESDTVFSSVFGFEQRLELNPDLDEFGPLANTERGIIYDATTFKKTETLPTLTRGVVVVLDAKYNVQLVRIANGSLIEIDGLENVKTATWTTDEMVDTLKDLVPSGGYVIIYPEGKNDVVINRALRAFYDYDFESGQITNVDVKNGISQIELIIKEVQEVSTLIVNEEAPKIDVNGVLTNILVVENSKEALVFNSGRGGAGFRLESGKAYYFTKEMYDTLSKSTEVVNSFTSLSPNKGVPWFNNGVIVILDGDGNFYQARLAVGAAAQINADGTVIFGNKAASAGSEAAQAEAGVENNLTWDLIIPNAANTKAHGPLMDILNVIPEGGSFFILPNSLDSKVRDTAIKFLWNASYTGGAIVEADNEAAATNGFDSEEFDEDYFAALSVVSQFVATETEKAPKLARPIVTIDGNLMTWANIEGAASYNLYVDGKLVKENVGTLNEDTYSFDLGTLELLTGKYTVQLRAITADSKKNSTSVLSDAVEYDCTRLTAPTNFVRDGDTLTWDPVTGATKYVVTVDDGEPVEVETNSFTIPAEKLVNDTVIKVMAVGGEDVLDSQESTHIVIVMELALQVGNSHLNFKEFTFDEWLHYIDPDGDNGISAANIEGFIVITDLEGLAELDDATKLFNGGYLALVDSEMKVKYVATRWGQSWDTENGWKLNGANQNEQWNWGVNLLASYVKPHLEDGDMLVLASQYGKGLSSGTYRNIFGNELLKVIEGSDHRSVTTFEEAIDPSTVTIQFKQKVTKDGITVGNTTVGRKEFTLTEWLNYADPEGGNDIGAAAIEGFVVVKELADLAEADDATKLFSGGYLALVDSDMKVKFIATRWGQSWDAENGWMLNGANQNEQWNWGATLLASYVKPHLEEGDMLVLASQYGKGLSSGNYRNLFGNELIKVIEGSDHRSVTTFEDVINPSEVTIVLGDLVEYKNLD